MLRGIVSGFLHLIFPPRCLLCGAFFAGPASGDGLAGLCPDCQAGLTPLPLAHCRLCGRPFPTPVPSAHVCAACRLRPPAFDRALAPGLFAGTLRTAIHRFKYSGRTELARPLAAFMARHLGPPFLPPQADLILPVPLHTRRLRERGFNQALLLCRALFASWPEKIRFDLLHRIRWTEPQVNLSGPARVKNVRRAFGLTRPQAVRERRILLVDDVYTTGATAQECARVLNKAGAAQVLVLTLARAP